MKRMRKRCVWRSGKDRGMAMETGKRQGKGERSIFKKKKIKGRTIATLAKTNKGRGMKKGTEHLSFLHKEKEQKKGQGEGEADKEDRGPLLIDLENTLKNGAISRGGKKN